MHRARTACLSAGEGLFAYASWIRGRLASRCTGMAAAVGTDPDTRNRSDIWRGGCLVLLGQPAGRIHSMPAIQEKMCAAGSRFDLFPVVLRCVEFVDRHPVGLQLSHSQIHIPLFLRRPGTVVTIDRANNQHGL